MLIEGIFLSAPDEPTPLNPHGVSSFGNFGLHRLMCRPKETTLSWL